MSAVGLQTEQADRPDTAIKRTEIALVFAC